MRLDTTSGLVNHLVTYINDDRAIVAHVKRDLGGTISVADVQRARRLMPRKARHKDDPLGTEEQRRWQAQARLSDARMVDRLAKVGAR